MSEDIPLEPEIDDTSRLDFTSLLFNRIGAPLPAYRQPVVNSTTCDLNSLLKKHKDPETLRNGKFIPFVFGSFCLREKPFI
jgi:hypothetical protein